MQSVWLSGLPNLLARYRDAYTGIKLKLQHASTTELLRLLHEGAADITFATALDEATPDVLSFPLFQSPLVVCTAEGPLRRQITITLHALAERDQVGFPAGWGIRILVDNAMRSAGLEEFERYRVLFRAELGIEPTFRLNQLLAGLEPR